MERDAGPGTPRALLFVIRLTRTPGNPLRTRPPGLSTSPFWGERFRTLGYHDSAPMTLMGLDVGFGTRRSCGLAVLVSQPELAAIFPHRRRYIHTYGTNSKCIVEAVTLRKGEAQAQSVELRRLLAMSILVVDGMLAPIRKPTVARRASPCRRT